MKKSYLFVLLFIIVGILSFTLPPRLMKWLDKNQVYAGYTQKAEEITLVSQVSMSLTEKILLYQRETANTLWVSTGKNYDQESIVPKIYEELLILCDLGILEIDINEIDFYAIEGGFVVDTADSTQTMNIWTIYAYQKDKLYDLLFVLDDETGKIINLQQSYEFVEYVTENTKKVTKTLPKETTVSESEVTSVEIERIAEAWAEYLGLNLTKIHHAAAETMDILCSLEDEKGMVTYYINKNVRNKILSIALSM